MNIIFIILIFPKCGSFAYLTDLTPNRCDVPKLDLAKSGPVFYYAC